LEEMKLPVVGVDDEVAVGPGGIFVSADEKLQCELFEDVIVGGVKFVVGKSAEDGARFGDVLDEQFVGEVGEQRVHVGSFRYLTFQVRKRVWFQEEVVRSAHDPSVSSEGAKISGTRRSMVAKQHLEELVLKIIPGTSSNWSYGPFGILMFMRLVSSIDAGKESHQDSASMLEGHASWPFTSNVIV
jgi:hypothetical protein